MALAISFYRQRRHEVAIQSPRRKRLLLFFLPLCFCSLSHAQFRERPATGAIRASRLATDVEGNLSKVLDFAVDGSVIALGFSPYSDYLAVATHTTLTLFNKSCTCKLLIWDALKEPSVGFEGRPPLAFSSEGKTLFFYGPQGQRRTDENIKSPAGLSLAISNAIALLGGVNTVVGSEIWLCQRREPLTRKNH